MCSPRHRRLGKVAGIRVHMPGVWELHQGRGPGQGGQSPPPEAESLLPQKYLIACDVTENIAVKKGKK